MIDQLFSFLLSVVGSGRSFVLFLSLSSETNAYYGQDFHEAIPLLSTGGTTVDTK